MSLVRKAVNHIQPDKRFSAVKCITESFNLKLRNDVRIVVPTYERYLQDDQVISFQFENKVR